MYADNYTDMGIYNYNNEKHTIFSHNNIYICKCNGYNILQLTTAEHNCITSMVLS